MIQFSLTSRKFKDDDTNSQNENNVNYHVQAKVLSQCESSEGETYNFTKFQSN